MKIEKPGFEKSLAVAGTGISTRIDTLSRKLLKEGSIPQDMVYVEFIGMAKKMLS